MGLGTIATHISTKAPDHFTQSKIYHLMKKLKILFLALLTVACASVISGQGKRKIEATDSSALLKRLIGTWKLLEYADVDPATGNWTYAYSKHPKGFFTYTKTGIVNLNISIDTALHISEDSAKNYNINLLTWVHNYSCGYFGTYTVDFAKSIVTHHVTGGSLPWYVDTDQPRPFMLKGDTLVIGDNKTWKRILVKAD